MEIANDVLHDVNKSLGTVLDSQREIKTELATHKDWLTKLDTSFRARKFTGLGDPPKSEARELRELAGQWLKGIIDVKRGAQTKTELYDGLGFGAELRAAMQEDTNTEGGFTVPTPLLVEIQRIAGVVGVCRNIGRVIPMTSKTSGAPRVNAEPTVGIVAEEGSIGESEATFANDSLTAKKIAAYGIMSNELLEDSAVALGDWLLQIFAEKAYGKLDQQALEGDGTGTNFTGIVAASGVGSVTNGTNGAAPSLDKLAEVLFATLPQGAQPNASWVMSPKAWYQLAKLKDSQNQYLLTPDRSAAAPLSLYNRPVYLTDQITTTRTVGTSTDCSNIYCGDFLRGLFIGERSLALDLDPYGRFDTAQTRLRFILRAAALVALPTAFVVYSGVRTTV